MQETKTITITTCDVCGKKLEFEDKYIPDVDWLNYSFKTDKNETRILKFKPDVIEYAGGKKVQVGIDICKDCVKKALDQMLRRANDFKVNIDYPHDQKKQEESFAAHMGH